MKYSIGIILLFKVIPINANVTLQCSSDFLNTLATYNKCETHKPTVQENSEISTEKPSIARILRTIMVFCAVYKIGISYYNFDNTRAQNRGAWLSGVKNFSAYAEFVFEISKVLLLLFISDWFLNNFLPTFTFGQ